MNLNKNVTSSDSNDEKLNIIVEKLNTLIEVSTNSFEFISRAVKYSDFDNIKETISDQIQGTFNNEIDNIRKKNKYFFPRKN